MSRCNSLRSPHSHTGGPQSITEWLSLCEKDPVEILLDLGFGTEEPDVCTKIPARFLCGSSVAKGIDIRVFLEAQKQRMDIELPNLYGRFGQLEVLDHITSALSSLLTDVNTQQTKAQETGGNVTSHLNAVKSRSVVTQAKRRIGQLLRRASQQTELQKLALLAPEEVSMQGTEEQPHLCVDTAERGPIQAGFSAHVTLGCLTQEQTYRDKGSSAYPISQSPPALPGKACASSHLVRKQLLYSPSEVPAKERPRKEPHFLLAQKLKKLASLNCRPPDSFEMEEIQSFEDDIPCGNTPDTTSKMMETRTSSCQSDSSGFMEELPEPLVLQNASLSVKMNIFSDLYNQQISLSHATEFPLSNQDFQQNQDDCVGEVFITAHESIMTVSRPTEAHRDQGEEISLLPAAENGKHQACNAELQSCVQDRLCDMKEYKTERQHLEKEECIEENAPSFKGGTQDEGEPVSSEFHCQFYFSTGCKNMNAALTELSDANPVFITESKIRDDDESERGLMEEDSEVTCRRDVHRDCTECGEELWWGVEVVIRNGALLAAKEETNRQKLFKMGADGKKIRCSSRRGLPETLTKGLAAPSCSSQVPPPCQAEGPGLCSPNSQEIGSTKEMLGTKKPELGDPVQNCEMARTPLRSVTVQMPSGLEFTSRVKCMRQNLPCTESLAKDVHVDSSRVLVHCSGVGSPIWSDPRASEDSVKQTTDTPSQTGENRKTGQLPVLCPPHSHLTKSASLDTMLSGKYRPHHCSETSGMMGAQGNPCCHYCCCHCCCCLWTCPVAVSPHSPMGCCSNQAANKLHVLRTLSFLQENAMRNLPLCTHEIELMKISCQHFHEKLDEIDQHLTEQQALFSNYMPEEGREESRNLQRLCQAVRQEMAELELCLNDRAYQVGEGILMQLDQLLVEQSHLFSELGLSDWKGERNAQNKQALPDAAGARSGCSKGVPQKATTKNTTAAGSPLTLQPEAPLMPLPTRTVPEPNSSTLDLQEPSISKKEIKGPPQAKTDFKTFMHNLKKSFQNPLGNDSAEGKDQWMTDGFCF
ncbi:protein ITPRID1 isoform X2 [Coturnix japonica]|uniref:protein ITPRID1 isoform X2 n=1 Tax=Coturnix japonica TaxID=93934 RepID=UPI0013A5D6F6|nr:protein ITPRID1 isoform X2 [Coturnix japonica]